MAGIVFLCLLHYFHNVLVDVNLQLLFDQTDKRIMFISKSITVLKKIVEIRKSGFDCEQFSPVQ